MFRKIKKILIALVVSLSLLGFADSYFEIAKNLDVFTTLYRELNNYYVDETDPGKLMKTGIDVLWLKRILLIFFNPLLTRMWADEK